MLIPVIAGIVFYGILSGFRVKRGASLFFGGLALVLLTEASPLHVLGMHAFLSAHMVAHIVVLLIAAPLMVAGMPQAGYPEKAGKQIKRFSAFLFRYPWVSWLSGMSIMWLWHIPAVFRIQAFHHGFISFLQPLSLLVAGSLFAWPLAGPAPQYRIHALSGILYLFTACIGCSALGLLLTFAPPRLFHPESLVSITLHPDMQSGRWTITQADDQQIAGLIMWVPCCILYLTGCLYLLGRWFREEALTSSLKQPV